MNSFQKQRYFSRLSIDLLVIFIVFIYARIWFPTDEKLVSGRNLGILNFLLVSWYFSAKASFLYERFLSRKLSVELLILFKTLVFHSTIIIVTTFFVSRDPAYTKKFIAGYLAILWVVLPAEKYFVRWFFGKFILKKQSVKILIIGAGELGINFFHKTVYTGDYGYTLAGFIDDKPNPVLNGEYLGPISEMENILIKQPDIQDIVIALPVTESNKIKQTVAIAEKYYKKVSIIPDYFSFAQNVSVSTLGTFPLISLRKLPLEDAEFRFFKRTFDIFFSIFLFIFIFSWLFPLLAFLIKVSSKGPVFFVQERWGLKTIPMKCLKFRTMVQSSTDTDNKGKYQQASKNDPRITKIGRLLRKTNLDELPQFFNVIKGDMSVVGPRPHPIPLNLESKDLVSNYMLRHFVKPGITGWAQVNGYRGETKDINKMQKRIDFDLWYIENWSFWLDIQIIFQTIINMLKGDKNAY